MITARCFSSCPSNPTSRWTLCPPMNPCLHRPARLLHPAFGYDAPHSSARGTSTLLNNALLGAHYEPVRLPTSVHLRCMAEGLSGTACRAISDRRRWDLPVLAQGSSTHVSGLRPREATLRLAIAPLGCFAFRFAQQRRLLGYRDFAAQYRTCVCPCQRFTSGLTAVRA